MLTAGLITFMVGALLPQRWGALAGLIIILGLVQVALFALIYSWRNFP